MSDRYYIAKWSNPNEVYTEASALSSRSMLFFTDKSKAISKAITLRKQDEQWSVVRQAENKSPVFIADIY